MDLNIVYYSEVLCSGFHIVWDWGVVDWLIISSNKSLWRWWWSLYRPWLIFLMVSSRVKMWRWLLFSISEHARTFSSWRVFWVFFSLAIFFFFLDKNYILIKALRVFSKYFLKKVSLFLLTMQKKKKCSYPNIGALWWC